jgi:hypothetical protein
VRANKAPIGAYLDLVAAIKAIPMPTWLDQP